MARKKAHQEHPDERWLLTYADMITLLMALFMVLYAMSSVSKTKFEVLKVSLHQTFSSAVFDGGSSIMNRGALKSSQTLPNSELPGQDTPQIGQNATATSKQVGQKTESGTTASTAAAQARAAAANQREDAQLQRTVAEVQKEIAKARLGAYAHVVQDRARGIVIIRLVSDRVLFDLGSWELKAAGKPLLASIARTVNKLPNSITVDGYTDAVPRAGEFGNDALSAYRALAVLQYMQSQGFDAGDPHYTYAIPHGARDPWKPNAADGSNALNRRVEIHILRVNYGTGSGQTAPPPLGSPIPSGELQSSPLG